MMVLPVRTIDAPALEDERMDDARVNTLRSEASTIWDELQNHPPDNLGELVGKIITYFFVTNEIIALYLDDFEGRLSRLEASIHRPASSETTESPSTPPE
jgi:hypothetical protein